MPVALNELMLNRMGSHRPNPRTTVEIPLALALDVSSIREEQSVSFDLAFLFY